MHTSILAFATVECACARVRVCDTADGGGGGSKRMFTTFSSVSALYKNVRPNVGGFLLFFFLKNIVRLKNLV